MTDEIELRRKNQLENIEGAITVLEEIAPNFLKREVWQYESSQEKFTVEDVIGELPKYFFPIFVNSSYIIGSTIHLLGHIATNPSVQIPEINHEAILKIAARIQQNQIPFHNLVTCLLGRRASFWFMQSSQDKMVKLQPHEYSRTDLYKLFQIQGQMEIESELLDLQAVNMTLCKTTVAAAWTMAALASVVNPRIFSDESLPFMSKVGVGGITTSSGVDSHNIVNLDPASLINVLRVLRAALTDDLINACDIMWIAAGLTRILSRNRGADVVDNLSFDIFLSHRGRDAKTQLLNALLNHGNYRQAFLDCLSLPKSLINRSFLFKSLARSKTVYLIETENYAGSIWCIKERWLTNTLAEMNLVQKAQFTTVDDALEKLKEWQSGLSSDGELTVSGDHFGSSGIASRIVRDIDYFGPMSAVKGAQLPTTPFDEMINSLGHGSARVHDKTGNPVLVMYKGVIDLIKSLPGYDPHNHVESLLKAHRSLWITAGYLSVAYMSLGSAAYHKMETRRYMGISEALCRELIDLLHSQSDLTEERFIQYQLLIFAAVTLQLLIEDETFSREDLIYNLIKDVAFLRDGLIMLDVRQPGAGRDFALRLLVRLLHNDVGTVGIIQNSDDVVHQSVVDGTPIDLLPCITFYPGMDVLLTRR